MSQSSSDDVKMSFWEHLDVLRASLIKMILAVVVCGIVAFLFKDALFSVVLAPKNETFVTYRLLKDVISNLDMPSMPGFSVKLINTGLSEQFLIHVKVSVYAGLMISSPYILYLLFCFVSPALYDNERRYSLQVVGGGYIMFIIGALTSYFIIFPLTFRFLGTYQVSSDVENMITLQSYIDTFIMMTLTMGLLFELPVVCWILAKMGILTPNFMRRYRRHAIVVILVAAAIITPTSDIFTMSLVALPIWLLYEVSILVVPKKKA